MTQPAEGEIRVAARHANGQFSVWNVFANDHKDAQGQAAEAVKTTTGEPPTVIFSSVLPPQRKPNE